jgi:hypothetical protein
MGLMACGMPEPVGERQPNVPVFLTQPKWEPLVSTEHLQFDFTANGFFVGSASTNTVFAKDNLSATVTSDGAADLAFLAATAHLEDSFDTRTFVAIKSQQEITENAQWRKDEFTFDAANKSVLCHRETKAVEARDETLPTTSQPHTLVSALFHLRLQTLALGETRAIDFFDGKKSKTYTVAAVGTVVLSTRWGPLESTQFEIKGNSRTILMWLANNSARVPLRIETSWGPGAMAATLSHYQTHQ